MSLELFYAKSYAAPAYGPGAEVALVKAAKWSPSSRDFEATAKNSGGGTGVGTLDDIIAEIGKKPVGSIDELGIIAHSNASYFSLSGTVLTSGPNLPNVTFTQAGMVDAAGLQGKQTKIDAVKDRFAKNAQVVLYACHAGLDHALIQAMAKSFGVCVYGFSDEVAYLIEWNTSNNSIISRGKTFIDSSGQVAAGLTSPASLAQSDIRKLTPGKKSSPGCPDYKTKTSSTTSTPAASG